MLITYGCCTGPEHSELSARWSDLGVWYRQVNSVIGVRIYGLKQEGGGGELFMKYFHKL